MKLTIGLLFIVVLTGLSQSEREQQLLAAKARYDEAMQDNFNILIRRLGATEKEYLNNTRLELTLDDDILAAKTYGAPLNKITISVATILFIEELGTTYAWYTHNNITNYTPVANYVLLSRRYRNAGSPLKSMIPLLKIPDNEVWDNPNNYDLKIIARNFLNCNITWILAHEIGHKAKGHVDNPAVISSMSNQDKEIQADQFATEMLVDLGMYPEAVGVAMIYYSMYGKVRIEFPDNASWDNYLNNSTHPIWPRRLENLALAFRSTANRTGRNIEASTSQLDVAAGILQNYDILSAMLVGSERVTESNLATYNPLINIPPEYLPYSTK